MLNTLVYSKTLHLSAKWSNTGLLPAVILLVLGAEALTAAAMLLLRGSSLFAGGNHGSGSPGAVPAWVMYWCYSALFADTGLLST